MTVPVFDRLHIVSDLHLGGEPGFQIFNQGPRLAALIERLAEENGESLGLVLNGDIVDFLAETPGKYLDPINAVEKLERVCCKERSFSVVWDALAGFVKRPHCRLILVLGNHDVELALPTVREWLLGSLSQGDAAARGRIIIAMDGAGFACKVGTKRVLCLHGNEVDTWNIVDYRRLLEVSRSVNRGAVPEEWDANAGTRMVIDVMNEVKREFPMVDLLKPEAEAVAPVILALDPSQLGKIVKLMKVASYLARDKVRRAGGFLSAEAEGRAAQELPSDAEVARRLLAGQVDGDISLHEGDVGSSLLRAHDAIEAGQDPKLRPDLQDAEFLGFTDSVRQWFGLNEKREELLRRALQKLLRKDRSFDLGFRDGTFTELDEEIGAEVDYLVAGHTHLERAIERRHPGRYYFNSGTWIRLIELTDEVLNDADEFGRVYAAFKAGSMEALDELVDLGRNRQDLVRIRPTVVSIVQEQGRTHGQLCHAGKDGGLQPVPGTRFPRS